MSYVRNRKSFLQGAYCILCLRWNLVGGIEYACRGCLWSYLHHVVACPDAVAHQAAADDRDFRHGVSLTPSRSASPASRPRPAGGAAAR